MITYHVYSGDKTYLASYNEKTKYAFETARKLAISTDGWVWREEEVDGKVTKTRADLSF